VLCNLDIEELSYHLIYQCPFRSECWDYLGISWDHSLSFFDTMQKAKQEFSSSFFVEISIAAWEIWKQRNGKIFRGFVPSFVSWKNNFFLGIKSQIYRLSRDGRSSLQIW
jgi:hypothetical protein